MKKKILALCLLLLCIQTWGQKPATVKTQVKSDESRKGVLYQKQTRILSPNLKLHIPVLKEKQKSAIIGSSLFLSGLIIKYGLNIPQSRKLEVDDVEGQLALISPQILAGGLSTAGTIMAYKKSIEAQTSYQKPSRVKTGKILLRTSLITGFAFMAFSQIGSFAANGIEDENDQEKIRKASLGLSLAQDAVLAFTNIYANVSIYRLKKSIGKSSVSLAPNISRNGDPALSLLVHF